MIAQKKSCHLSSVFNYFHFQSDINITLFIVFKNMFFIKCWQGLILFIIITCSFNVKVDERNFLMSVFMPTKMCCMCVCVEILKKH